MSESHRGRSLAAAPSRRIAIIGAGHVGATAAYAMMLRGLFPEIVLIDNDQALASAEAADLCDASALARPARIWAGSYKDAASASIAVITAGAATHGSESRLSVAARSATIVTACTRALRHAGFDGILLVAANPVDVMTAVAARASHLPASKILGTGTLLDSNRLRQRLATHFKVASSAVEAVVLGEHGDSEVPIFSSVRIGGLPLEAFPQDDAALDTAALAKAVREAAYSILAGKGYTSYGIATAIVRICEAIIRDEQVVLPVSTLMHNMPGMVGIPLSLPCVIGASGVQQVLTPMLSEMEAQALGLSASAIRAALDLQAHSSDEEQER